MGIGIVIWQLADPSDDASLRLVAANAAASRLMLIELEPLVGGRMVDLFPGVLIVRRDVERHGGSVCVTSRIDRGTTFWVTLPAAGFPGRSDPAEDAGSF